VKHQRFRRVSIFSSLMVSTAVLAGLMAFPRAQAQDKTTATVATPSGTLSPIRLNSSLSSRTQPGQIITARIMQDVRLANSGVIREGSKVIGRVVDASSPADANTEQISLQFDKLISSGRTIPVRTNSRAVAGFVAVMEAGIPADGPASTPIATTQVGGETASTSGGPVEAGNGVVVGKSVNDGVLVQARADSRQGRDCRGVVDDNKSPRAMWFVSSDACGTYGLSNIRVAHAGKTEPVGVFVLASEKGQLKLPSEAGML
jgi:hypothetical protein